MTGEASPLGDDCSRSEELRKVSAGGPKSTAAPTDAESVTCDSPREY